MCIIHNSDQILICTSIKLHTSAGSCPQKTAVHILLRDFKKNGCRNDSQCIFHIEKSRHRQTEFFIKQLCFYHKYRFMSVFLDLITINIRFRILCTERQHLLTDLWLFQNTVCKICIHVHNSVTWFSENFQFRRKIVFKIRMLDRTDMVLWNIQKNSHIKLHVIDTIVF